MLSNQQIGEHISAIRVSLDRFASSDGDFSQCLEVNGRFEVLREQYRRSPGSLAGHVSQLTELSERFDELLARRLPEVVDRFHAVNEQLRRIGQEKEFWREFLIRTATSARQESLAGSAATVRVRSVLARPLPSPGTNERTCLEEVLRASGQWEQVSQLSGAKVQRALAAKLFDEAVAQAVEQLAPATVIHQVSSRATQPPRTAG
jgi:hypothetical protein